MCSRAFGRFAASRRRKSRQRRPALSQALPSVRAPSSCGLTDDLAYSPEERGHMTSPTRLDTALFWDAAQRQSLAAVRCGACGALSHPPTARCPNCGERQPEPFPVEGKGRLYASTVVERQTDPRWPVPYTIVLV